MAVLVAPAVRFRASFLAAVREFRAEPDFVPFVSGLDLVRLSTPGGFTRYVDDLLAQRLEHTPRPRGFVPTTTLWWVDGEEFLGRLAIRHRLTPTLHDLGGHIGYDVRPGARRRGHATAMLAEALPLAHQLGIDPALVMCDDTNEWSQRIVERNGGEFLDQRGRKLRYRVPTAHPPS